MTRASRRKLQSHQELLRKAEAEEARLREKKSCSGKDKLTRTEARDRARKLTLQLREQLGYYQCQFCNFWHVGHS